MRNAGGFTFVELMMASLVSAIVGGGTLMAFVTAARIARAQASPAVAEANALAAQTIEWYRNRVAADDNFLLTQLFTGWVSDPLPGSTDTESIQQGGAAERCYRVTSACGGSCYQMEVKVCWGNMTGCPCP